MAHTNSQLADDEASLCEICLKRSSKVIISDQKIVCFSCKEIFLKLSKQLENATAKPDELLRCKCIESSASLSAESRKMCQFCRYKKCRDLRIFSATTRNKAIDFKSLKCSVCFHPSSGYHYGTVTCDSCKSFFVRTVQLRSNSTYRCQNDLTVKRSPKSMLEGDIDKGIKICRPIEAVNFTCKFCRFYRCLQNGMSLETFRRGRHSYYMREKISHQFRSSSVASSPGSSNNKAHSTPSPEEVKTSSSSSATSQTDNRQIELSNFLALKPELPLLGLASTPQWKAFVDYLNQPAQSSPFIWLYGSAKDYINLDSYKEIDVPLEQDPLCLVRRFFKPTLSTQSNFELNEIEQFLSKLVPLMKVLQNISMNSIQLQEEMSPDEAWRVISTNFMEVGRYSLAVVKSLPHFERLSTSDRKFLFAEAFFPLWAAEQIINTKEGANSLRGIYAAHMSETSKKSLCNTFNMPTNVEKQCVNAAQSMKQANLCIVEYALMIGLLFFDSAIATLQEPKLIKEIRSIYIKIHESFVRYDYVKILEQDHSGPDLDVAVMNRIDRLFAEMDSLRIASNMLTNGFLNIRDTLPGLFDDSPFLNEVLRTVSRKPL